MGYIRKSLIEKVAYAYYNDGETWFVSIGLAGDSVQFNAESEEAAKEYVEIIYSWIDKIIDYDL